MIDIGAAKPRCPALVFAPNPDQATDSSHMKNTWSRFARLIQEYPEVKQVRLDSDGHRVTIGFYETPSDEILDRIKSTAARELSGEWDISEELDGESPIFHLHKIDNRTAEFHRAHPANEPPVIWKRIPLPAWRNRPVPPLITRDYRVMLSLAATCGLSTLCGFLLQRAGLDSALTTLCFAVAYLSGGWFATQDVWHGLKRGKIDIQFLMIAVALGALAVKGWTEGAALLFPILAQQRPRAVRQLSNAADDRFAAESRAKICAAPRSRPLAPGASRASRARR
jgi:Cd2+/Zn2+-exporting ATPase